MRVGIIDLQPQILELLNVDFSIYKTIKEYYVGVKLYNSHVLLCGNSKHYLDGFIFFNGVESLIIIYIIF